MTKRAGTTSRPQRATETHPPIPSRKVSETLLDFGAPVLELAPPFASRESLREVLMTVITIWNACAMDMDVWGQPDMLQDLRLRLADPKLPAPMRALTEALILRRKERFGHDPRAVGDWDVVLNGDGGFRFRCDARLPGKSFGKA